MELLVHISTSGHLLVACLQVVVAVALIHVIYNVCDVHVIMGTPTPHHLLLWVMTIFVRVLQHPIIGMFIGISMASIPMLLSGMVRCVRVVAAAVSSTILHGSPRT